MHSERYPRKFFGSLILLFAGFGHVGKFLLAKYIEENHGFPALQLMAIACLLSFLVYSCAFSVSTFLRSICKSQWPLLRIICAGTQTVLIIIAFDRLPVGNVMAIYVTSGAFASVFSDDKLQIWDWVAISLSIMGVILISKPEFIFGNMNESQMENVNPSDYW